MRRDYSFEDNTNSGQPESEVHKALWIVIMKHSGPEKLNIRGQKNS